MPRHCRKQIPNWKSGELRDTKTNYKTSKFGFNVNKCRLLTRFACLLSSSYLSHCNYWLWAEWLELLQQWPVPPRWSLMPQHLLRSQPTFGSNKGIGLFIRMLKCSRPSCQMNKPIFELWRVDNYLMSWRKEANLCVMFVLLCNAHTASPLLQHLSH